MVDTTEQSQKEMKIGESIDSLSLIDYEKNYMIDIQSLYQIALLKLYEEHHNRAVLVSQKKNKSADKIMSSLNSKKITLSSQIEDITMRISNSDSADTQELNKALNETRVELERTIKKIKKITYELMINESDSYLALLNEMETVKSVLESIKEYKWDEICINIFNIVEAKLICDMAIKNGILELSIINNVIKNVIYNTEPIILPDAKKLFKLYKAKQSDLYKFISYITRMNILSSGNVGELIKALIDINAKDEGRIQKTRYLGEKRSSDFLTGDIFSSFVRNMVCNNPSKLLQDWRIYDELWKGIDKFKCNRLAVLLFNTLFDGMFMTCDEPLDYEYYQRDISFALKGIFNVFSKKENNLFVELMNVGINISHEMLSQTVNKIKDNKIGMLLSQPSYNKLELVCMPDVIINLSKSIVGTVDYIKEFLIDKLNTFKYKLHTITADELIEKFEADYNTVSTAYLKKIYDMFGIDYKYIIENSYNKCESSIFESLLTSPEGLKILHNVINYTESYIESFNEPYNRNIVTHNKWKKAKKIDTCNDYKVLGYLPEDCPINTTIYTKDKYCDNNIFTYKCGDIYYMRNAVLLIKIMEKQLPITMKKIIHSDSVSLLSMDINLLKKEDSKIHQYGTPFKCEIEEYIKAILLDKDFFLKNILNKFITCNETNIKFKTSYKPDYCKLYYMETVTDINISDNYRLSVINLLLCEKYVYMLFVLYYGTDKAQQIYFKNIEKECICDMKIRDVFKFLARLYVETIDIEKRTFFNYNELKNVLNKINEIINSLDIQIGEMTDIITEGMNPIINDITILFNEDKMSPWKFNEFDIDIEQRKYCALRFLKNELEFIYSGYIHCIEEDIQYLKTILIDERPVDTISKLNCALDNIKNIYLIGKQLELDVDCFYEFILNIRIIIVNTQEKKYFTLNKYLGLNIMIELAEFFIEDNVDLYKSVIYCIENINMIMTDKKKIYDRIIEYNSVKEHIDIADTTEESLTNLETNPKIIKEQTRKINHCSFTMKNISFEQNMAEELHFVKFVLNDKIKNELREFINQMIIAYLETENVNELLLQLLYSETKIGASYLHKFLENIGIYTIFEDIIRENFECWTDESRQDIIDELKYYDEICDKFMDIYKHKLYVFEFIYGTHNSACFAKLCTKYLANDTMRELYIELDKFICDVNYSKKENQRSHCLVKNSNFPELNDKLINVIEEYGSVLSYNNNITYSKENRGITTFIQTVKYRNDESRVAQILFLGKIKVDKKRNLCEMIPYNWGYTGEHNINFQDFSITKINSEMPFIRHITDTITYEFSINNKNFYVNDETVYININGYKLHLLNVNRDNPQDYIKFVKKIGKLVNLSILMDDSVGNLFINIVDDNINIRSNYFYVDYNYVTILETPFEKISYDFNITTELDVYKSKLPYVNINGNKIYIYESTAGIINIILLVKKIGVYYGADSGKIKIKNIADIIRKDHNFYIDVSRLEILSKSIKLPIIKIKKHPTEDIYVFKLMSKITKNVLNYVIDGKRFSQKPLSDAIGKFIKIGYSNIDILGNKIVAYHCDKKTIEIANKPAAWETIAGGS